MNKDRIVLPDPADIAPDKIAPMMAPMAAIQLSLATRLSLKARSVRKPTPTVS